jgi:hypothetical protein
VGLSIGSSSGSAAEKHDFAPKRVYRKLSRLILWYMSNHKPGEMGPAIHGTRRALHVAQPKLKGRELALRPGTLRSSAYPSSTSVLFSPISIVICGCSLHRLLGITEH